MTYKFWKFQNVAKESAELLLYGEISDTSWFGDEVTPRQFAQELEKLGQLNSITVRINSGGGDVFAASAIGNLLEQHKATVTAKIDGLCASAATIVACHCDKVMAAKDSIYMIHPAKAGIFGYADAASLQTYIDALTAIRENIVDLYARKTGRDKAEVGKQMDDTSWWTGEEAMEHGFVDELVDEEGKITVENRDGIIFVNSTSSGISVDKAPKFVQEHLTAVSSVEGVADKPADTPNSNQEMEDEEMEIKTVDDLRKAYPELVNSIEQAAAEQATAAERKRIRDIEEMSMAGNEDFTNEAKYEKPISVSDYAIQAMKNAKQAEERQQQEYLSNRAKDYESSGMKNVGGNPVPPTSDEFMDAIKFAGGKK